MINSVCTQRSSAESGVFRHGRAKGKGKGGRDERPRGSSGGAAKVGGRAGAGAVVPLRPTRTLSLWPFPTIPDTIGVWKYWKNGTLKKRRESFELKTRGRRRYRKNGNLKETGDFELKTRGRRKTTLEKHTNKIFALVRSTRSGMSARTPTAACYNAWPGWRNYVT